jgi:hypothetical protein
MKVNGKDYPISYGKKNMFQITNQVNSIFMPPISPCAEKQSCSQGMESLLRTMGTDAGDGYQG